MIQGNLLIPLSIKRKKRIVQEKINESEKSEKTFAANATKTD